jgi:Zn-dependent protease with chaperone function
MTRSDFDELVRRIERRYAGDHGPLERATAIWIALGLAGILAWVGVLSLLGIAAFAAGVVAGPEASVWLLGVGSILLAYAISQAGLVLLVAKPTPEGRALRAGDAPALVELLDALARETRCRPFDEVRITMDFNAGVHEIPRLGLLGWPRTVLQIGLPLLMTLSPDEMRAVLAHEMAHMSARHGRIGGRIYRLTRCWGQVFEGMQRPASGRGGRAVRSAAKAFIDWYWPRLRARTLVLSRAQEYQADSVAEGLAGGAAVASALWRMECRAPWLGERFWPDIHAEAVAVPDPPAEILGRMRAALEVPAEAAEAARWVERGLSRATENDETHPAFVDRARALGLTPEAIRELGFPTAIRPSAAEALLGPAPHPFEADLASEWSRTAMASWRERHRRAARAPALGAAEPRAEGETTALWEAARHDAELRGLASSEPLLRRVLAGDPSHAGACVLLGHHLVAVGDAEGERLLWQVIEKADDHEWIHRASVALEQHYRVTGRADRLRDVRATLDRYEEESEKGRRERSAVGPNDRLLHHDLDENQLSLLRNLLAWHPDCASAWLVRKDLRYFPLRPLFILCVQCRSGRWLAAQPERERALVQRLIPRVELSGQVLVLGRNGSFRRLAARVRKSPGAEVFRRDHPLS